MSTQKFNLVAFALRSVCHHTRTSRLYVHQEVLGPLGTSGCCVPVVSVPQRRAYSIDSTVLGPGRPTISSSSQQLCVERTSCSSAVKHRRLSTVAVQGEYHLSQNDLNIEEEGKTVGPAKRPKAFRYFIGEPTMAKIVTKHLGPNLKDPKTVILECNPGPGVLTRTLLKAGAHRVVALEGQKSFLPGLQKLQRHGQLDVLHCDYFKLDPIGNGPLQPPVMHADQLFAHLGIPVSSWTDDIPMKVVGILPLHNERGRLFKMIYNLFEQLSVYRYGRVELNLFIREKEYQTLVASPGNMSNYRAFSVLWQIACDIQLLHTEHLEYFPSFSKHGVSTPKEKVSNDQLCLVRLRPRADLFSSGLTPFNSGSLLVMIKQCLTKRKSRLIDRLNLWSPGCGNKLLAELGLSEDIQTGWVCPEAYLRLFELMEKSQEFKQSWLFSEIIENTEREGWI